ncbi:hypothetical protein LX36DRAFT_441700 [Colletotrichum falcatum]|nr:hypothetical protein LX36DRAFT_441700 [Colletotrichum falcatum]
MGSIRPKGEESVTLPSVNIYHPSTWVHREPRTAAPAVSPREGRRAVTILDVCTVPSFPHSVPSFILGTPRPACRRACDSSFRPSISLSTRGGGHSLENKHRAHCGLHGLVTYLVGRQGGRSTATDLSVRAHVVEAMAQVPRATSTIFMTTIARVWVDGWPLGEGVGCEPGRVMLVVRHKWRTVSWRCVRGVFCEGRDTRRMFGPMGARQKPRLGSFALPFVAPSVPSLVLLDTAAYFCPKSLQQLLNVVLLGTPRDFQPPSDTVPVDVSRARSCRGRGGGRRR